MKRIPCLCGLLLVLTCGQVAAQNVTAPSAPESVASANDFATRVFQDPWDMNERTDIGWWLNSVDFPYAGFSSATFSGGIFSGVVTSDPNLWLLETNTNLAPVAKTGSTYPLNADVYRIFAVRMKAPNSGNSYFMFWSSTNTMYDGLQPSQAVLTTPEWRIYIVDMATLQSWSGTKRSLRFDPAPDYAPAGSTIDIDWVRLVDNEPGLYRTIQWTNAGGNVDIYLDNDNAPTNDPNQTLGLLASNVSGNSYSLNVGALAPGRYYVAIRRTGTTGNFSYSPGYYQVNAPATITVTSPSDEASWDDFATVQLNNAWDMTTPSDVDHVLNVVNNGIATLPGAETEAGTPLGNVPTYVGTSTVGEFNSAVCTSFAKPVVFPLHSTGRGVLHHIDPNRYRILTLEMGLPNKARDLCNGSIIRIGWQVAGETQDNLSIGITLNSRAGANVVDRINVDLADRAMLPLEPAAGSQSGWVPGNTSNPGIVSLRIDPHEFASPTPFFIKRIKLASLDSAHTGFTIAWTLSKAGGTVRAYYDTDKDPSVKTLIGSTGAGSTTGSLFWNTSGLPQGARYYVYIEFDDGLNVNGTYAKWPVEINHSPLSNVRIAPNRSTLNFGVVATTIKTPPQTIRLTTVNGSPCWTATSDLPYLIVSPTSGCGSTTLTVTMANQNYYGVTDQYGYIRINAPGTSNSPQYVLTMVRIRSSSTAPSGLIDTPQNGVGVTGSFAVTGWAVDDIGVSRVVVCRDPVSSESVPHPACPPGQIYLGDAVSIDDTRPDVEAYSPNTPLNYRAGWGFMVLTNTLPNQGNGAFTLYVYASDVEGHVSALGSRVIFAQNSTATEPFGTIDTPGQGETISGATYSNFGWVLSRVHRADPPGGGSVMVFVDGVAVGSPCCWNKRADLSAIFPGYPGIDTALGVLGLNTFTFGNGLHTIVWVVTDNFGITSGIGSRYFSVFNASANMTLAGVMRPVGPDLGRSINDLGGFFTRGPLEMREGFRLTDQTQRIEPGLDGTRRVWATERDRVELQLNPQNQRADGDEYAGYLLVDGKLRELPQGSSFDPRRGAFYWQPGLGYMGDYELLFVRTRADGVRERIPVRVTLQPRPADAVALARRDPWSRIEFRP